MPPSPSDPSMIGVKPPHMGPVAHGFAALGDAAERAVSAVAALAADAAQAPSRLGNAAALLTDDGKLGTLWQVIAPFSGVLLGAIVVALAVNRQLTPQRKALAALRPSSAVPFALGLLRSLLVDTAPIAAYACLAGGGSFLLFWDHGLVFSGTETFQMVASLIVSTSVVAWLLIVVLSLPLAIARPGLRCVPLDDREAAAIRRFMGRIVALGAASWITGVSLYLSWVGAGFPRLLLILVGLVICAMSLRALARIRSRFSGFARMCHKLAGFRRDRLDSDLERCVAVRPAAPVLAGIAEHHDPGRIARRGRDGGTAARPSEAASRAHRGSLAAHLCPCGRFGR